PDTATLFLSTLPLHDALPIYDIVRTEREGESRPPAVGRAAGDVTHWQGGRPVTSIAARVQDRARVCIAGIARQFFVELPKAGDRSEEHTSELQSRGHLVCRLL